MENNYSDKNGAGDAQRQHVDHQKHGRFRVRRIHNLNLPARGEGSNKKFIEVVKVAIIRMATHHPFRPANPNIFYFPRSTAKTEIPACRKDVLLKSIFP